MPEDKEIEMLPLKETVKKGSHVANYHIHQDP